MFSHHCVVCVVLLLLIYSISQKLFTQYVLCCGLVVVWYQTILLISFRITSLALGQLYDCPSANEIILIDMGKHIKNWQRIYITATTKQSTTKQYAYFMGCTVLSKWMRSTMQSCNNGHPSDGNFA